MTVTHNQFPSHNVTFHHDADAQPDPIIAVWFLHGLPRTNHRRLDENVEVFCMRILDNINEERGRVFRVKSLLDPQAPSDVYVGELEPDCLASLKVKHLRNFILSCLQREVGAPASAKGTGASRLAAMNQLARMTGIPMRRRKVVKAEHLPASV